MVVKSTRKQLRKSKGLADKQFLPDEIRRRSDIAFVTFNRFLFGLETELVAVLLYKKEISRKMILIKSFGWNFMIANRCFVPSLINVPILLIL